MKRILIYVQHIKGVGHLSRILRLRSSLEKNNFEIKIISGGMPLSYLPLKEGDIQLPPILSHDYKTLLKPDLKPVDDIYWNQRLQMMIDGLQCFKPHILITEHFPLGRFQFQKELIPFLDKALNLKIPYILGSVRDIICLSEQKQQKARDLIKTYYDGILVHGDSKIFEFPLPNLIYTGYLAPQDIQVCKKRQGILASFGGGDVGHKIINTLKNIQTEEPIEIMQGRVDFLSVLSQKKLSISMAGYNTVVESLATKTPMILIPYDDYGEEEQVIRAKALQDLGLCQMIPLSGLTKENLKKAIAKASFPMKEHDIDLGGLQKTIRFLKDLK
jgi:predicted glycosyltransferase